MTAPVLTRTPVAVPPMRTAFAETTGELLDEDPELVVLLADISAELFREAAARHPERVVNVGIREQLLVSAAAGLAMSGLRPIVHTFASFLVERPFEQLKLDFGHQDVGGVLVSAGASYDISSGGRTHQAPGDVALLDTLPDWTIHVPGHADELRALLRDAAAARGRVYLRTSTGSNAAARPLPPRAADRAEALVIRRGNRGTVVAVGPLLDATLAATEGLDVTVLYVTTVRPWPAETLRATLGTPDVVLVEPYLAGTSTRPVDEALRHLPHRVLGLGVGRQELRRYGTPREHQAAHGLDAAGLRRSITDFLGAG